MKEIVSDGTQLCEYLKGMVIDTLKLEDITKKEIENDAPLFGDGLGLDSIDALELVVAIEKAFDVVIEDENVGKTAFASIETLATFIQEMYKDKS